MMIIFQCGKLGFIRPQLQNLYVYLIETHPRTSSAFGVHNSAIWPLALNVKDLFFFLLFFNISNACSCCGWKGKLVISGDSVLYHGECPSCVTQAINLSQNLWRKEYNDEGSFLLVPSPGFCRFLPVANSQFKYLKAFNPVFFAVCLSWCFGSWMTFLCWCSSFVWSSKWILAFVFLCWRLSTKCISPQHLMKRWPSSKL